MSPREDTLFAEATELLPPPAEATALTDTGALAAAMDALTVARRDLEWNVYPTDTTTVVKKMLTLTENLRLFFSHIPGGSSSQFRDDTVVRKAHKTLALLHRHLALVEHYDATQKARLARPTTEADAELEVLTDRGAATKQALAGFLEDAQTSLSRVG